MIQGSGWFDAVQLLTSNERLSSPGRVQLRSVPILAPDGTEIKYEPDYHRTYGKVLRVRRENPKPAHSTSTSVSSHQCCRSVWSRARYRSFSRRKVCTPMRLDMSQTRMERSSELEMMSSYFGWNMTQDTLFVCPRSVSTSHAFVSAEGWQRGINRGRNLWADG